MTLETIEDRLFAAPFLPLTVHVADGRFFPIDHPDYAFLLRVERTLVVHFAPGRVAYVDVGSITTLETTDAGTTA